MKKDLFKYLFGMLLIAFSFYYADQISKVIIYKSSLMQDIVKNKEEYEKQSVNAIINGNYIIPGLNGLKVLELDSYYQMREDKIFSESKLVFSEITPQNNIASNKGLIINKANPSKKKVSIIIDNNPEIEAYLIKNKIKANKLVDLNTYEKDAFLEQINNADDYNSLEKIMQKFNNNNNLCLVNSYNKKVCLDNDKLLIEPTYFINNSSLITTNISSGDIIRIDNTLSLANFKFLMQKITYQDLGVTNLSNLISEKRSSI